MLSCSPQILSDHILSYELGENYFSGMLIDYTVILYILALGWVRTQWVSRRLRLAYDKVSAFIPATFQPVCIITVSSSQ